MLQKRLRIPKCHGQDLAQLNKYKYVKKLSKEIKILKGVLFVECRIAQGSLAGQDYFLRRCIWCWRCTFKWPSCTSLTPYELMWLVSCSGGWVGCQSMGWVSSVYSASVDFFLTPLHQEGHLPLLHHLRLFFFLINCFIFGCAGSLLLHELFPSFSEKGLLSSCSAQASHSGGFSCGAWALGLQ